MRQTRGMHVQITSEKIAWTLVVVFYACSIILFAVFIGYPRCREYRDEAPLKDGVLPTRMCRHTQFKQLHTNCLQASRRETRAYRHTLTGKHQV
jgi:hypothetical protein